MQMGKTAAEMEEEERQFTALLFDINRDPSIPKPEKQASDDLFNFIEMPRIATPESAANLDAMQTNSGAIAAMLRAQAERRVK